MKNCICEGWKDVIGFWKPSNPFNSSKSSIPMYFGKEIFYCPWCGYKLIEDENIEDLYKGF